MRKFMLALPSHLWNRADSIVSDPLSSTPIAPIAVLSTMGRRKTHLLIAQILIVEGLIPGGTKGGPHIQPETKHGTLLCPLLSFQRAQTKTEFQKSLDKTKRREIHLHWKIHVHELALKLLAQYRRKYPNGVVSTICAMSSPLHRNTRTSKRYYFKDPFSIVSGCTKKRLVMI